jgi:hypothetical protein
MKEEYKGQIQELKEKVRVYEQVFHDIQFFSEVVLTSEKVVGIIDILCAWSRAHRSGEGPMTNKARARLIARQFNRLKHAEYIHGTSIVP